ncbi:endonuclease domain-containing protein [Aestuariivivens sediminicola]|uniref:endonuclease domain-containing protein n=1 Tax=Aestuariivivens sediminicola TaxID=2913560 RepID=UPI001F58E28C|nr:endonuclease domain-containing protein [Aestuariivivens sediminicola]
MQKQRLHTKKELEAFRKELRHKLTPAEAFLWKQLKAKNFLGRRFTKQHSIAYFIVDFYCATEKLIIELDGEAHNHPEAQEYDDRRTTYLESLGYTVIRFENRMVFENLASVLNEISSNFKS